MVVLGDPVPEFSADSTKGRIDSFKQFCEGKWTMLFSHPSDFTPVCTSELGAAAKLQGEFAKRGVQLAALSCNDLASHQQWVRDIEGSMSEGQKIDYPIIADPDRSIAKKWGMLDPDEKDTSGKAFAARCVFIIGPDATLKLSLLYPSSTGRNFDELLRVIDSLLLASKYPIATPANWHQGEEVMIAPSVSDEEAKKLFPDFRTIQVKSGKAYIRKTMLPEDGGAQQQQGGVQECGAR
ncbi:glutathione peroxidase [Micractinium conductrix]|uniref:Peroxiredoxin n=1 Tax=Micractinium conductrix TaxID=554055 RepID=A0A2P6VLC4_9CHLO|nr:glutathione peroxidase [Micractinium conductrix]|eukprot:PSC74889.1 glutathione peroxidase [Micractinium conductrix]